MRILLITSKWPTVDQEIDGGCMTGLNVLDTIVGYSRVDILLPEGYKGINITGINKTYFYPVDKDIIENYNEKNKFMCRIKIAEIISSIVLSIHPEYDKIVVLHAFHAFTICNGDNFLIQNKVILFPMLLTPSYVESGEDVPAIYTKKENIVLHNSRAIITPSIFEREQIRKYYNVPSSKISVVPRFVGREFKFVERDLQQFFQLNICYIASIKKQKQNMKAVELLQQLLKMRSDYFLYIVGPIHDHSEFHSLINYIRDNGLSDRISLVRHMTQSEVNKLFSICLANISVARCETFGRSIIEGLYCGLPAFVLNDTKCFRTLIGENHGVLYCDSVYDMAIQIHKVFKTPVFYNQMQKEARDFGVLFDEQNVKPILKDTLLCNIK